MVIEFNKEKKSLTLISEKSLDQLQKQYCFYIFLDSLLLPKTNFFRNLIDYLEQEAN